MKKIDFFKIKKSQKITKKYCILPLEKRKALQIHQDSDRKIKYLNK